MDTTPIPHATSPDAELPKKYIRTFAGDMEVFKKGGTPDLKPLEPPRPQEVRPPADTERKPTRLKTYASDFSQRIKDTHASTATVLAAEQDALSGAPREVSRKSSRGTVLYITAGVILFVFGIAGSYIAYTRYLANEEPIILAPAISAPIFVDEKEKIVGASPQEILLAIEQSVLRQLAPNTVRFLYIDLATGSTSSPQATTDNSVFLALQLPAPGALLRNVNSARSMAGILSTENGLAPDENQQNPFFILSVASYSDTFAGMLSWESRMPRDLSVLFPLYPQLPVSTVSTSSTTLTTGSSPPATTTATSTPVFILSFRDEVINNHDVRIYRDAEGRSVLLYGYWNQTTLIIARDPAAFIEIIGRLATTRAPS